MKKRIWKITVVFLTLVMLFTISVPSFAAAKVKLSKSKAVLEVDAVLTLKLNNAPATVTWKSSDKTVATVKKGKVTAKSEGIATITATCNSKKYTCTVTVVDSNKGEEKKATPVKDGIPTLADCAAFKVVDCYKFETYGYTSYIYLVDALKTTDAAVKLTITDKDGNILDTSSDDIALTEGKQNFFSITVDTEKTDKNNKFALKTTISSSFWSGDTDAVKVVKYNKSDNDLFITVKQVKDNLGTFAKLKMLFYNNGEVVDAEECYYSVYAKDLDGKGTEAVMDVWVYGINYTDIEFFYQDR